MSAKQLAWAATRGRRISFRFLSAGYTASGYLVGMDDYHWMVAVPRGDDNDPFVETTLVHKGSADLITIERDQILDAEPPAIRVSVEEIGRPFFSFCERTYLGK